MMVEVLTDGSSHVKHLVRQIVVNSKIIVGGPTVVRLYGLPPTLAADGEAEPVSYTYRPPYHPLAALGSHLTELGSLPHTLVMSNSRLLLIDWR